MPLCLRVLLLTGLLAALPARAGVPSAFAAQPLPFKQRVCGMLFADISAQQVRLARQNPAQMSGDMRKAMLMSATEALIFLEATGYLEERSKAQAEAYAHALEEGASDEYMAVVQACHTRYRPRKTEAEIRVFVEDARQVLREQLGE